MLRPAVGRRGVQSQPIERAIDIANTPNEWGKAHDAFSGLRKSTLELDAQEALRIGLVNRVVAADELEAEGGGIARRLAQGATAAFAEIKRLVDQGGDQALAAQLNAEAEAFERCAGTGDFVEGVTAFVEKRKPIFKGE